MQFLNYLILFHYICRQFLDFGGWHDRDKLYWKEIIDVVIVAACAPPGGGRNPLTARFVRHLAMLHVAAPDSTAMITIFKVNVYCCFNQF